MGVVVSSGRAEVDGVRAVGDGVPRARRAPDDGGGRVLRTRALGARYAGERASDRDRSIRVGVGGGETERGASEGGGG